MTSTLVGDPPRMLTESSISEYMRLDLLGGLDSNLSGLGIRLPPVSSPACTPPSFAPRPLELELDGDVIPGSLSGSGGSMGARVSRALGFEGGGLGAGLEGRLWGARP